MALIKKLKVTSLLIIAFFLTLGLSISLQSLLAAWTGPTTTPPGGNASGAINIGSSGQSKVGGLILNTGGSTNGLIVESGKVGIGTIGPNSKLTIANNVATGYLDNYGEYQILLYDSGVAASSYGLGIKGNTVVFNSGAGAYSFDAGAAASRMVIDISGNVGVGVASPSSRLHVLGSSVVGGLYTTIFADAPSGQTGNSIAVGIGGTKHWTLYDEANVSNRLDFYNSNNSLSVMTLLQNGNVGIGKVDPSQKLDVAGAIAISGSTVVDSARNWQGQTIPSNKITEADPKVGTINNGSWCAGSGGQVVCNQSAPSSGSKQVLYYWNPSGNGIYENSANLSSIIMNNCALSQSGSAAPECYLDVYTYYVSNQAYYDYTQDYLFKITYMPSGSVGYNSVMISPLMYESRLRLNWGDTAGDGTFDRNWWGSPQWGISECTIQSNGNWNAAENQFILIKANNSDPNWRWLFKLYKSQ